MSSSKRAGLMSVFVDGVEVDIPGDSEVTYNMGVPKATALKGLNGKGQGYKEEPQVSSIEFPVRDRSDFDLAAFCRSRDVTVTANLANGKTVVLREAVFAGDGDVTTGESQLSARFESPHEADEI